MSVTMTPAATERVQSFMTNRGKGLGLRHMFNIENVNIIIDTKSLVYLDGIELDFVKEGLNEGFKFTNPNAKGECGCGESFNV